MRLNEAVPTSPILLGDWPFVRITCELSFSNAKCDIVKGMALEIGTAFSYSIKTKSKR